MNTRIEPPNPRVTIARRDVRGAPALGKTPTAQLPGHLPKITKLDVELLGKKGERIAGVKGASLVAEVPMGLPTSGLIHLSTGETLVVRDDKGVFEVRPGEEPRRLFKMKDLEGITVDDKEKYVYVVEENARTVHKLEIRRDDHGGVELHDTGDSRKLPKFKGGVENKGWEGIAFLSKDIAGGKHDCLVCVHEGSPRRIGIYELPDLDTGVTLKLPKEAKKLLPDLADAAIDPKTGHIFVVSDQGRTIVELAITRQTRAAHQGLLDSVELTVVSSIDLPISGNKKPEGLRFDSRGRLWVGLDYEDDHRNSGRALVIELTR